MPGVEVRRRAVAVQLPTRAAPTAGGRVPRDRLARQQRRPHAVSALRCRGRGRLGLARLQRCDVRGILLDPLLVLPVHTATLEPVRVAATAAAQAGRCCAHGPEQMSGTEDAEDHGRDLAVTPRAKSISPCSQQRSAVRAANGHKPKPIVAALTWSEAMQTIVDCRTFCIVSSVRYSPSQ